MVISTLHTVGAVNTMDRIIDVFPPNQQQQIRVQLAIEIMHFNNAIRSMIRDSRIHQIDQVIQTSAAEGMISMDESILRLYKAGRITAETALRCAMIPEQLARRMGR